MLTLVFLFITLVVLDIAAFRWGFTSSDGVNNPEWERRQQWYGFHSTCHMFEEQTSPEVAQGPANHTADD